jgi:tetratricopeptide (TPR) repeat protein
VNIKYKTTILAIVLEHKSIILLSLSVFVPFIMTPIFADSIDIEFDKLEYFTGDSITISGHILEVKMPVIAMSIYAPDGTILSANNIEIDSNGFFSKTFFLDSVFYDASGLYEVKFNYGKITQTEFFNLIGSSPEKEIISPDITNSEIILLFSDKTVYVDGDVINISGFVSSFDSATVLIGVYDPYGNPAGFYFEPINTDLEFSTSFLAKSGVNFKVDGTYSIKAHYGESEEIIFFDFFKQLPIHSDDTVNVIDTSGTSHDNTTNLDNQNNGNSSSSSKENISNTPKDNSHIIKEIIDDSVTKSVKSQNKKYSNLSIEDIELGKLLNQINLECDQSKFIDTISYYDGMGPALYRLCKFDQALISFDDSLTKDPYNVEILTNKGSALGKLGRLSESIIYYDKAIEIDQNFIPAINNKANALANMGKLDESVLLYTNAIEKNPDFQTARKNLSMVLMEISSEQPSINMNSEAESSYIVPDDLPHTYNDLPIQIKNSSQIQIDNSSNFFENIGIVFSSLGSLLNFLE